MKSLKYILALLVLGSSPALAAPFTYSPEGCEFTITFPSEPYETRKCNPDDPKQCHNVVTFTKVFDLSATLNLSVVCNPAEKDMFERYSGDVMKTTLIAMAGRGKLEEFETGYDEKPGVKMANILGYGKKDDQDLIYNGQLWIGKKSMFSLEADITGDYVTGADEMFAQILQSVTFKEWQKNPPAKDQAAEKEGKPADEPKPEDDTRDKSADEKKADE